MATAEGFRLSSIDQGRGVLVRYDQFLHEKFGIDLNTAGWKEFAAYKAHLAQTGIARTTVRGYLSYIIAYYRVRAQATQDPQLLDLFTRLKAIGLPRRAKSVKWTPFTPEVLTKILGAARSQATLAELLKEHLTSRNYQSGFLFRHGHDANTRTGQKANRQNAWRARKRVEAVAGVPEKVHPHRFRKTLATMGKRLGLDPQFLQAILAHESVTMTLDRYAEVELEDVKREFAKLDLSNTRVASAKSIQAELIEHLKKQSPLGKEPEWNRILEGLVALLREGA